MSSAVVTAGRVGVLGLESLLGGRRPRGRGVARLAPPGRRDGGLPRELVAAGRPGAAVLEPLRVRRVRVALGAPRRA